MLPVPIEILRVRIGLDAADASKDDTIEQASETALALMGNYCDRRFPQVVDVLEFFTHITGLTIPLIRYPLVSITSIVDNNGTNISAYHIAAQRGIINLDVRGTFHELIVTYTGGYAEGEYPADLLSAFYSTFDQEFAAVGGSSGAGSVIQSVTVQDVGTVRFDTGSSSGSNDGGSVFLPASAVAILSDYKRYKC